MALASHRPVRHMVHISLAPAQAPLGHATTLRWRVAGIGVAVLGVQLSSNNEKGICMIESLPAEGSRQLIFTCAGSFTFTLTATFSDGARRRKHVRVLIAR